MLLLEVPGGDMLALHPLWDPHGASQAHQWIVHQAGLVMDTDLRLHAGGLEMGRGTLDLVVHLQDTKAGFLTITFVGIG